MCNVVMEEKKAGINLYIYIHIPNPSHKQDPIKGQFFKQGLTGLPSPSHTRVKEASLPYYLTIFGERIVGCITFPKLYIQLFSPGFNIWSLCLFTTTVTITPRTPPLFMHIYMLAGLALG